MTHRAIVSILLFTLSGGCTFDTSGVPFGTATPQKDRGVDLPDAGPDLPSPDLPEPDLPPLDIEVNDLPADDLPQPDLPPPDLPPLDMPPLDLPPPDMPLPDMPVTDGPIPDQLQQDQWADPPDLWPALDKPKPDMAQPDQLIFPDFWPAADVKQWPDMKIVDMKVTDLIPHPPDVFPLATCDSLYKGKVDGYKLCTEGATTCRFFHDEGFLGGSYSCTQLCSPKKCLGAWDTSSSNKCSTSNGANCSAKFNTSTCICDKW